MEVFTYKDIVPSLVPNTAMKMVFADGVHKFYTIRANMGYVLHDKGRGWADTDPNTMEEVYRRGYTRAEATCPASYDFSIIEIEEDNGVKAEAYGMKELFAVRETDVPTECIF